MRQPSDVELEELLNEVAYMADSKMRGIRDDIHTELEQQGYSENVILMVLDKIDCFR